MREHKDEKRGERPPIAWLRAAVFLAIGAVVGWAGGYWLRRGWDLERLDSIRREWEPGFGEMVLIRRPRPLTEDETALIRDFIAKARRWQGTHDAAARCAGILVSVGVQRDELASVLGVSEEVLHEWDVESKRFGFQYRNDSFMSVGLDEEGRVCNARTSRGLIWAMVEEDSNGELRLIKRRGYDWKPPPPETPPPSGDEPDQRGKE
jgi:hypothetical protein